MVNSISLKEGEAGVPDTAPAAYTAYGAAAVVMLFDEQGQADTYARKIEVAERAYKLLTDNGFPRRRHHLRPQHAGRGDGHPKPTTATPETSSTPTRWIKENLPDAKVSGGVSNLSFAFRGNNAVREAMHSAFLYHAIAAGMDMGIVNPADAASLQRRSNPNCSSGSRTSSSAAGPTPPSGSRNTPSRFSRTAENVPTRRTDALALRRRSAERIGHAMLKGVADYIEQDALEGYRRRWALRWP